MKSVRNIVVLSCVAVICLTNGFVQGVMNDIITVRNRAPEAVSVWLTGYRTTSPVVVQPGEDEVLITEEPGMICTMAFVIASIVLHAKIGDQTEQEIVTRKYNDGCGFSKDRLLFIIGQSARGPIITLSPVLQNAASR